MAYFCIYQVIQVFVTATVELSGVRAAGKVVGCILWSFTVWVRMRMARMNECLISKRIRIRRGGEKVDICLRIYISDTRLSIYNHLLAYKPYFNSYEHECFGFLELMVS